MKTFDYELDEFQPLPGHALYVYGHATIEYTWERGDPDAGVPSGAALVQVTDIWIDAHLKDGKPLQVLPNGFLFALISHALLESDHVLDTARKHCDGDRQWKLF
jgi:hypothetical protein